MQRKAYMMCVVCRQCVVSWDVYFREL